MTTLPSLQQSKAHFLTSISPLNKRREQVRRERVISLQKSVSQSFKERQFIKDSFQQNWNKINSHLVAKQSFAIQKLPVNQRFTYKRLHMHSPELSFPQTRNNLSKSVWRIFTNTFMRDGEKLRYQNILRKALLLLPSDK